MLYEQEDYPELYEACTILATRKRGALHAHSPSCPSRILAAYKAPENSVHAPGLYPVTNLRVPHISLVFREMWDSTDLPPHSAEGYLVYSATVTPPNCKTNSSCARCAPSSLNTTDFVLVCGTMRRTALNRLTGWSRYSRSSRGRRQARKARHKLFEKLSDWSCTAMGYVVEPLANSFLSIGPRGMSSRR